MASAPRLLADAVALKVVTARDVHVGAASVSPVPRSNAVHRVELAGAAVGYVKQAGAASLLDGDDTVAVERAALRRLSATGLTPALIARGRPGTVWSRAVDGAEIASVAADPATLDAAAAAFGSALAGLARMPSPRAARRAATPWPLLPDLLPSMEAAPQNDDLEWVLEATVEPAVVRALGLAGRRWRTGTGTGFVHGDVSRHNVVVGPGTAGGAPTVTFVDLEACGLGDPAWDVACAVETLTELDRRPGEPSVDVFRAAYGRAGGDPGPAPEWDCVRALMTAWQAGVSRHPGRAERVATALEHARDRALEAR